MLQDMIDLAEPCAHDVADKQRTGHLGASINAVQSRVVGHGLH